MSEMLTRAAAALEQAFKDRISATAGQPFESIGVTAPGFDVWEAYARAAVLAMREPTDDMYRADEQIEAAAWMNHGFTWQYGAGQHHYAVGRIWRTMVEKALEE